MLSVERTLFTFTSNRKLVELAKKIEAVNPKEDKSPRSSDTEIFEI
jgi:hypothetical protein